jgi:hypothetical protein
VTYDTRYICHYNEINCNYKTVDIQYTLDTKYICHYNEINCNYKTVDIQYTLDTRILYVYCFIVTVDLVVVTYVSSV